MTFPESEFKPWPFAQESSSLESVGDRPDHETTRKILEIYANNRMRSVSAELDFSGVNEFRNRVLAIVEAELKSFAEYSGQDVVALPKYYELASRAGALVSYELNRMTDKVCMFRIHSEALQTMENAHELQQVAVRVLVDRFYITGARDVALQGRQHAN